MKNQGNNQNNDNSIIKREESNLSNRYSSILNRGLDLSLKLSDQSLSFDKLEELCRLPGHRTFIGGPMIFSENGDILAVAGQTNEIQLWNLSSGTSMGSLIGHTQEILCMDISSSQNHLASGGYGRELIVWDIEDLRIIQKKILPGAEKKDDSDLDRSINNYVWNGVNSIRYHPTENIITLAGSSIGLLNYDIRRSSIEKIPLPHQFLFQPQISKNRKKLISRRVNGFDLWNITKDKQEGLVFFEVDIFYPSREPIALSADGEFFVFYRRRNKGESAFIIDLVNSNAGKNVHRISLKLPHEQDTPNHSEKEYYFNYSQGDIGSVVKLSNSTQSFFTRYIYGEGWMYDSITLSDDGKLCIIGNNSNDLILIDYHGRPHLYSLNVFKSDTYHMNVINGVAHSTKKRLIAAVGESGEIVIWSY